MAYKIPNTIAAIIHSSILPIPKMLPNTENNLISPAPIQCSQNAVHNKTGGTMMPKRAEKTPILPFPEI